MTARFSGCRSSGRSVSGWKKREDQQARDRRDGERAEDRPPVRDRHQPGAHERRQYGRDRDHHHHRRHQPCRGRPGVKVSDDRPWHHHQRRSAQALDRPAHHQPLDRGREGAEDRAQQEHDDSRIKRRLAPRAVGPGAIDQLRQAKGDEIGDDRALHRLHGRAKVGADLGHGGEVHVDGEGADAVQKSQDKRGAQNAVGHGNAFEKRRVGHLDARPRLETGGLHTIRYQAWPEPFGLASARSAGYVEGVNSGGPNA